MNTQQAFDMVVKSGIMAGIRGNFPPDVAADVTATLMESEINVFEFTMTSPQAIEAMQATKAKYGDSACVGMGTVLDPNVAKKVIDAGADFIVSPAFDPYVVETARHADILIAPGVITPTEAVQAWSMGLKLLKLFPVGALGIEYFKAILGPLQHMKFMANGAMDDQNAREFLKAGAVACGMVGWLTGDGTWQADKIRRRAETLRAVVTEVRTGVKPSVTI